MRKLALPFSIMLVTITLFFLWIARLPPFDGHPEPVPTALAELSYDQDAVRVEGTAHYVLRVSYDVGERWGRPAHKRYLFPLFERHDTMGRHILAMVSSPHEPERLVSFEDLAIDGEARKPQVAVTASVVRAFQEAGYSFDDDYVLVEVYLEPSSGAAAP